jgi:hypothetical protein
MDLIEIDIFTNMFGCLFDLFEKVLYISQEEGRRGE